MTKDNDPWWKRPVYLDDSGLVPYQKRDRLYVLQDGKCGRLSRPGPAADDTRTEGQAAP